MPFPFHKQLSKMDCGPACIRMIARYYGKHLNPENVSKVAGFSKEGVNLLGLSDAAENIGFKTRGVKITFEQLTSEVPLPCILHWNQNHFVVMLPISRRKRNVKSVRVADPAKEIISYDKKDFLKRWGTTPTQDGQFVGTALLLEPTQSFYEQEEEKKSKLSWGMISKYLARRKWQVAQVFIALLITSLLQLIFPFITQSLVDTGINTQNLQYITIVLIAQLMLVFSRSVVDFIRARLLLHISSFVNFSILSDFWVKLTRLPMSYFDTYHTGDTMQRLGDHKNIQSFLTGPAITTLFSLFSFVVFAIVLAWYSSLLFFIFAVASGIYFLWIILFLRIRRKINYQNFGLLSRQNNTTLQLVQGMQEIKLYNAEQVKRWEWENLQASIIKLNFRSLSYSQVQQAGAILISQGKDIVITFLVARLVVEGQLTLGAMLAIQYIIGQLNAPVEQFIGFTQSAQDARISMERLNEIHNLEDEDSNNSAVAGLQDRLREQDKTVHIQNLSFAYPGAGNEPVLKDINLEIPEGKVTAIVGVSGSGKTTLLKLLLKFYDNYSGTIKVSDARFQSIHASNWRKHCGAVLQDGFIFNDTVANNIAIGSEETDIQRLIDACKTANILTFIDSLPGGFNTKLGSSGVSISQGQRQRILIARVIYKNPQFVFFDEATNSLDAETEKTIVGNLQHFFKGKTVVVVAHRLSTVKYADKIVVIHEGKIAEEGSHHFLSEAKGRYYSLVKNQLELG